MAKRNAKPAANTDLDDDLDFEETPTSPGADDDDEEDSGWMTHKDDSDDLWDSTDDVDEAGDGEDGSGAENTTPAPSTDVPPAVVTSTQAVNDVLSRFALGNLTKRMLRLPLSALSNEWVLTAYRRVDAELDKGDDSREVREELELDRTVLLSALEARGIETATPPTTTRLEDGGAPLALTYIEHARIHPDPLQPRVQADAELRDSIRANGILQPVLVRRLERGDPLTDLVLRPEPCAHCGLPWSEIAFAGDYLLIDGERRWRGADGVLDAVPAIVRDDQADEYDRLKTQLVANTGKPLTPIEEARTFARMLTDRDVGIAGLARDLGKPASTINDRLKLLELGPWLAWIASGSVTVSMAVEHLVPLRGIPDAYHADALAKITDGLEPGDDVAESIEDFGHAVARAYDTFMYPLGKSKNDYEKQPLFSTKHHDDECSCGGITWGGSWQGVIPKGRKHCGNPDWWKPLHTAAKKAQREVSKESGGAAPAKKGELRIELPAGTPTIHSTSNAPKLYVVLTDSEGRWMPTEDRWNLDSAFDPADLVIDESKLVRLKEKYVYGVDRVVTKDVAAVNAARAKFAARFAPAREKAAKKLVAEFEKLTEIYGVSGAGVHALLGAFEFPDAEYAEMGELLGLPVPKAMTQGDNPHRRTSARVDWFAKVITRADAERLCSFVAFRVASDKRVLPSDAIKKEMRAAVEEFSRKRSPWATTKAPKPVATAAKAAKKGGAK